MNAGVGPPPPFDEELAAALAPVAGAMTVVPTRERLPAARQPNPLQPRYATRIVQAGGIAELHVWPGGFHAFDGFLPEARLSEDAWAARRAWLTRVL
jgi:acetyl esterase/lipase